MNGLALVRTRVFAVCLAPGGLVLGSHQGQLLYDPGSLNIVAMSAPGRGCCGRSEWRAVPKDSLIPAQGARAR